MTCCFLLDILITFRTGYVDYSGNEIFDARLIAVRFVSSLFVVDALAAFPFHIFSPLIDFGPSAQFVDNCLKVNFLLRASKLINSDRIDSFISPQARISKLLFGFLCLAHFFACLFFFVGSVQSGNDSWILRQGLQLKPHSEQYICALYWSIATMVTVVSRTGDAQERKGNRRKRVRTEEGDEGGGGRMKGWQQPVPQQGDGLVLCPRSSSFAASRRRCCADQSTSRGAVICVGLRPVLFSGLRRCDSGHRLRAGHSHPHRNGTARHNVVRLLACGLRLRFVCPSAHSACHCCAAARIVFVCWQLLLSALI